MRNEDRQPNPKERIEKGRDYKQPQDKNMSKKIWAECYMLHNPAERPPPGLSL